MTFLGGILCTAQSQKVGVDSECVSLQSLLFQVIFSVRLTTE